MTFKFLNPRIGFVTYHPLIFIAFFLKTKQMSIDHLGDNPSVVLQKVGVITCRQTSSQITEPNYVKSQLQTLGSVVLTFITANMVVVDLSKLKSQWFLGHESSGIIVEVGDNVTTLKAGDDCL